MKRFLIGVLVFVLVFSVGFAQSSQKQKKNFRLSFSLPHVGGIIFQNYLYSSFDPTDFNRNLNQVGRFSDEIHYDLLFRLLEGAKSWITASIGPAPFGARSSIYGKRF